MAKRKKDAVATAAPKGQRLNCAVPSALYQELGTYARFARRRLSDVVTEALQAYMARVGFVAYVKPSRAGGEPAGPSPALTPCPTGGVIGCEAGEAGEAAPELEGAA